MDMDVAKASLRHCNGLHWAGNVAGDLALGKSLAFSTPFCYVSSQAQPYKTGGNQTLGCSCPRMGQLMHGAEDQASMSHWT